MDELRERWNQLYKDYLPSLAKSRDPVQERWPVYLDHCFARIILDNAVGLDKPWMEVVKQPAVKHMSAAQLEAAIDLGEKVATGEANLTELNEQSLRLRGKQGTKRKSNDPDFDDKAAKKKRSTAAISKYFMPSPESASHNRAPDAEAVGQDIDLIAKSPSGNVNMAAQLRRIADSDLTSFRKQTLTLLCEIPPGRYSTYQAMSDHITKTSHKTCARAVGNAMRNNPFAPEVPCHRILAADGSLGGFGGHWGENGKFASKKHELLHDEGVRFDSKGKVKGPSFRDFT